MAILQIREIGDPVLRSRASIVENVTDKTRELIDNMVDTMYQNNGIGLAAPQVGILQQIIVIDIGEGDLVRVINPEIISREGKTLREEGCLSIPGETGIVPRAKHVKVTGLNYEGEEITVEADDLLARAFQHEIDHLQGKLFIDKVVDIEKDLDSEKKL